MIQSKLQNWSNKSLGRRMLLLKKIEFKFPENTRELSFCIIKLIISEFYIINKRSPVIKIQLKHV